MEPVEFQIFPLNVLYVRVKIVQPGADHRAKAGVDAGLGVKIVFDIHVKGGGDAA